MIGGHGQLKNSGVIESCGIYVIAVDNHYFDLMNLSTGLVVALTRDVIFMRTNIRNEGLVQGFTCVDAVGAKKLTNSSSGSIISKGSCRLHFKIIEQGGELGAADQLTLIADGKMVKSGDIVVSHGDMIITCEGPKGLINSGRAVSLQQKIFITASKFQNSSVIQAGDGLAIRTAGLMVLCEGAVFKSLGDAAIVCDSAVILGFCETKGELGLTGRCLHVSGIISVEKRCRLIVAEKLFVGGIITAHIIDAKCESVTTGRDSQIGALDTLLVECQDLMSGGTIRAMNVVEIISTTLKGKHIISGLVECEGSGPIFNAYALTINGRIVSSHCVDMQASHCVVLESSLALVGGISIRATQVDIRKSVVIRSNGSIHIAKFTKFIAPDCQLLSPLVMIDGVEGSSIKGSILAVTCKCDEEGDSLSGRVLLRSSRFRGACRIWTGQLQLKCSDSIIWRNGVKSTVKAVNLEISTSCLDVSRDCRIEVASATFTGHDEGAIDGSIVNSLMQKFSSIGSIRCSRACAMKALQFVNSGVICCEDKISVEALQCLNEGEISACQIYLQNVKIVHSTAHDGASYKSKTACDGTFRGGSNLGPDLKASSFTATARSLIVADNCIHIEFTTTCMGGVCKVIVDSSHDSSDSCDSVESIRHIINITGRNLTVDEGAVILCKAPTEGALFLAFEYIVCKKNSTMIAPSVSVAPMTRFHNHGHVESQTGDLSLKITDCCLDSVLFNQEHVAYYNEGTIVAGGGRLEVVVTGAVKENGLKKILTAIVEKGILEAQHIHLEAFIVLQEGQLRTREGECKVSVCAKKIKHAGLLFATSAQILPFDDTAYDYAALKWDMEQWNAMPTSCEKMNDDYFLSSSFIEMHVQYHNIEKSGWAGLANFINYLQKASDAVIRNAYSYVKSPENRVNVDKALSTGALAIISPSENWDWTNLVSCILRIPDTNISYIIRQLGMIGPAAREMILFLGTRECMQRRFAVMVQSIPPVEPPTIHTQQARYDMWKVCITRDSDDVFYAYNACAALSQEIGMKYLLLHLSESPGNSEDRSDTLISLCAISSEHWLEQLRVILNDVIGEADVNPTDCTELHSLAGAVVNYFGRDASESTLRRKYRFMFHGVKLSWSQKRSDSNNT
jgi:hypothetical protein